MSNEDASAKVDAHLADIFGGMDSGDDSAPEPVAEERLNEPDVPEPAAGFQDDGGEDGGDEVADDDAGAEAPKMSRAQQRIVTLGKERDAEREKVIRMEERFSAMQAMQRQRQAEAAPPAESEIPDYDEDPAGHLQAKIAQLEQQNAIAQQNAGQQQQQSAQQQVTQQTAARFNNEEQSFAQDKPDYFPAIEALKGQRTQMWQDLGYSPDQAAQAVAQEAMSIVTQAAHSGRSAAEIFYGMAKPLYAARQGGEVLGDDGPAAPTPARRASGLGSKGGKGGKTGATTLGDLSSMSDADFASATSGDNWADLWGD